MRSTGSPFASRTGAGSKLWAAESAAVVADEGDGYETGVHEDWSVVGPGVAQVVLEAEADRRRHDPLNPNDEGSTTDQVLPRTRSRPAAAHEMPGTYRSTMTPPGIGSTRAEVTGMVPSTVLKCWCPYTPMCSGVSSARSSSRSRSRPTVIAAAAVAFAE